jgi:hypothetical protein
MTWSNTACLTLFLLVCGAGGVLARMPAQNPDNSVSSNSTQPAEGSATGQSSPLPKAQFFGGTVTELDGQHITVSRTSLGKSPEHRTFVINIKTKMSKTVKVRSRVTVRYRHLPEGDVALEISIRPLIHTPRAS